jgi:putative membrane protein
MENLLLQPSLKKNDKQARLWIWTVSVVVFTAVAFMANFRFNVNLGFNVHVFAEANAVINSLVAALLVAGLVAVKQKNYEAHKKIMLTAIILSVLFLVSYICHHLFAGETKFGDLNHDGILSDDERVKAGSLRYIYFIILFTHIPLAAVVLPFILFTAYRALIGEYEAHKKLTRITWPLWFYVAFTGVIVYLMINPYYS